MTKIKKVKPFIKWFGGKRLIANKIQVYFPEEIENYYEPFVGGGAVFFRSYDRIKNAYLYDLNKPLMITYKVVRDNVEELITKVKEHENNNCKDYYYKIRSQHNLTNDVEIASRLVYLNRACHSGGYRENQKGEFNLAYGNRDGVKICYTDDLRQSSRALQGVELNCSSFNEIDVKENSLVYCDPPYHKTLDYYNAKKFNEEHHKLLSTKCVEWIEKGCKVIVSNSDTEFIRSLYDNEYFDIKYLDVHRAVNRTKDRELLIVSK